MIELAFDFVLKLHAAILHAAQAVVVRQFGFQPLPFLRRRQPVALIPDSCRGGKGKAGRFEIAEALLLEPGPAAPSSETRS